MDQPSRGDFGLLFKPPGSGWFSRLKTQVIWMGHGYSKIVPKFDVYQRFRRSDVLYWPSMAYCHVCGILVTGDSGFRANFIGSHSSGLR